MIRKLKLTTITRCASTRSRSDNATLMPYEIRGQAIEPLIFTSNWEFAT